MFLNELGAHGVQFDEIALSDIEKYVVDNVEASHHHNLY